MSTVNRVILLGRLGKDPEMRTSADGVLIANVSLATESFGKEKQTEWHNLVAFNKAAEVMQKYCTKGDQIYIEGSISTEKWKDKEGNQRSIVKIIVGRLTLLGKKSESRPESQPEAKDPFAGLDDDIPSF
jgi:single-strand DNA-binding protein